MNALFAVLLLASAVVARPSIGHEGIISPIAYAAPAPVAYAAPIHARVATVGVAAPIATRVAAVAPVSYTASVSVPVTKTVHYANTPVVTGYSSTVVKPALGDLPSPLGFNPVAEAAAREAATSGEYVTKTEVLAPGRSVASLTPKITQVVPEVSVKKVPVDVPVAVPTPVATPVATPVHTPVAVSAITTYSVAAPAVHLKTIAAPAVVSTGHTVVAAPQVYGAYGAHFGYGVAGVAGVAAPQVEVKNIETGEVQLKTLAYGAPYGAHYGAPYGAVSYAGW